MKALVIFLVLFSASVTMAETVYTWTDEEGVIRITNIPPDVENAEVTTYKSTTTTEGEGPVERNEAFPGVKKDSPGRDAEPALGGSEREREEERRKKEEALATEKAEEQAERARIESQIEDLESQAREYKIKRKRAEKSAKKRYWHRELKSTEEKIRKLQKELGEK